MNEEERTLLATRIADRLSELGMTQGEAAAKMGVNRVTLSRWKAGWEVDRSCWPALLEVLGIEVVESVSISVDYVTAPATVDE